MTIERNQCQAKLDILIEGFMRADWAAYRDAVTWLRDFADQKNIDAGRVMCGGVWSTPRTIEAVRERARMGSSKRDGQRRRGNRRDQFGRAKEKRSSRNKKAAKAALVFEDGTVPHPHKRTIPKTIIAN